ncbi:hypothetical protein Tco_0539818 [Tanacetum coccineum]
MANIEPKATLPALLGLVCFTTSLINTQVVVTNPLTREVKKLQSVPRIPKVLDRSQLCFGFSYDSSTDDYKFPVPPFCKLFGADVAVLGKFGTSFEDDTMGIEVQVAVLEMIAEISRNKNSAFKSVVKKVSGIVVGITCSGVGGLRDASMNTLRGLASIDTDLIWILLADVYYSKNKEAITSPPPVEDLPPPFQLVPPPSSPKSYLYVQYVHRSVELDRTRRDTRSRHQVTLEVVIQIHLSVVVAALVSVKCEFFEIILVIDEESFDQL